MGYKVFPTLSLLVMPINVEKISINEIFDNEKVIVSKPTVQSLGIDGCRGVCVPVVTELNEAEKFV